MYSRHHTLIGFRASGDRLAQVPATFLPVDSRAEELIGSVELP